MGVAAYKLQLYVRRLFHGSTFAVSRPPLQSAVHRTTLRVITIADAESGLRLSEFRTRSVLAPPEVQ